MIAPCWIGKAAFGLIFAAAVIGGVHYYTSPHLPPLPTTLSEIKGKVSIYPGTERMIDYHALAKCLKLPQAPFSQIRFFVVDRVHVLGNRWGGYGGIAFGPTTRDGFAAVVLASEDTAQRWLWLHEEAHVLAIINKIPNQQNHPPEIFNARCMTANPFFADAPSDAP